MNLSYPLKLFAVLHLLLSVSLQVQSALADSPPNIVVFLSDDQGWGDFGFQGNSNFQTPNLDQLAHSGAVCQRFYVCPV
ncbi:MAG: sulfatase-like hydrolase/transferase, partial [Planctomycetota bacterium]